VAEVGSSTGIYAAQIAVPLGFDGVILWDSGDSSVRYAAGETLGQLNSIQDETDKIRMIWNSLRSQGEFFNLVMDRLGAIEKNRGLKLTDVRAAMDESVSRIKFPAPAEVKIPAFPEIPDLSAALARLEIALSELKTEVGTLPKQQTEYHGHFKNLNSVINGLVSSLSSSSKKDSAEKTQVLLAEVKKMQKVFGQMDGLMQKLTVFNEKLDSIETNGREMAAAKRAVQAEVQRMNLLINMLASTPQASPQNRDLMLMFGHRKKK
jgi:hypothetical protein